MVIFFRGWEEKTWQLTADCHHKTDEFMSGVWESLTNLTSLLPLFHTHLFRIVLCFFFTFFVLHKISFKDSHPYRENVVCAYLLTPRVWYFFFVVLVVVACNQMEMLFICSLECSDTKESYGYYPFSLCIIFHCLWRLQAQQRDIKKKALKESKERENESW